MKISSVFKPDEEIPLQHTCMGRNVSPALSFYNLHYRTKTLALLFEDRDTAPRPWVHWLVFNIPASTIGTGEGQIPAGGTEGLANNRSFGYEGPCPKYFEGMHRYVFTLFALDKTLDLPADSDKQAVLQAMEGHIVETAGLAGLCRGTKNSAINV